MSSQDWYTHARRKVLIDNHLDDWLPGYEKYDSKVLADRIGASGFEAAMIYARCHVGTCYWNASNGPKHRGLGDRDQIGELTELLHERGIKMILYYSNVFDRKLWDDRPDWRVQGPFHGPLGGGKDSRYRQVCPNSPYREYTVSCLEEIARNYEIDGAFFDMTFWPTICQCTHCQRAWQEASGGRPMPEMDWTDPVWKQFVKWRYSVITDFLDACRAALHKYRPGIVVSYQSGNPLAGTWGMGVSIDQSCAGVIPSSDIYYTSGFIQMSLVPRLFRSVAVIRPVDLFISRPVEMLWDMPAMKPFPHMLAESCTYLANGTGIIFIDQMHPDGSVYEDHWEQFKQLNDEIRVRQEYSGGEPVPFAAVYFSEENRDFYGQNEAAERVSNHLAGVCKALIESHVLFDIVTPLNLNELGKYKVLFLPNIACLSEKEVAAIRAFVADGGGVVGTYEVSTKDEMNQPLPQPALSDVFGIRVVGNTQAEYTDTYIRVLDGAHPVTQGLYTARPITIFKPQVLLETLDHATPLAHVVYPYIEATPARYVSIHNNPPGVETERPAIVANTYGKGRAVYFGFPVDCLYALRTYWEFRALINNAVRWAAGASPEVELEAPMSVELTAWDQEERSRRVFHLVNLQSDISRTIATHRSDFWVTNENMHVIQEMIPVHDLKLRFAVPENKQLHRVTLQPSNLELSVTVNNATAEVQVPKVWIHEVVVAEWV